jgi:integrase
MASVWKRDKSKYWYACYTAADGRQLKRSTKTTDRKKALKIAVELEQAAQSRKTKEQIWKIVTDIQAMFTDESIKATTTLDQSEAWLYSKRTTTKKPTYQAYEKSVLKLRDFLGDRIHDPISELEKSDIAGFRDHVGGRLSATTANFDLKVVRMMLEDAYKDGYLPSNPAASVRNIKKPGEGNAKRAFTIDELGKILSAASGEWKGLVLMGLYTGQRLRDIALLQAKHVLLDENVIVLRTSKTDRMQRIPLAQPLRSYLESIKSPIKPNAYIFPEAADTIERSKSNSTAGLSNKFHDVLADAGLVERRTHRSNGKGRRSKRETSEISFHALRHTTTSMLKQAGVSAAVVQDLIGHESKAISNHYTHIDDEAKAAALGQLPALL